MTLSFGQACADDGVKQATLWSKAWFAGAGMKPPDVVEADRTDRRLQGERWRGHPWFSLPKQSYLLNAGLIDSAVGQVPLERRQRQRLRFFTRQVVDALSPANFGATNLRRWRRCWRRTVHR